MFSMERKTSWIRRALLVSSLAGLVVSVYLLITYMGGGPIVCGVAHGCDVVRASEWSSMYGVPTPLLGVLFYLLMIGIVLFRTIASAWKPLSLLRLTRVFAIIGLLESIYLTYVQAAYIGAYCSWCLTSGVITLILFCLVWFDRVQIPDIQRDTKELKIQFLILLLGAVFGGILIYSVVFTKAPEVDSSAIVSSEQEEQEKQAQEAFHALLYPKNLSWKGAQKASVQIVEFVDFECPACRVAYKEVEKLLAEEGSRIRFAYRMFPLPTHPYAKGAALAAVCADAQGYLFPYAKKLMEEEGLSRDDLIRRAEEVRMNKEDFVSCLDSEEALEILAKDMQDARDLGVAATPTFFVNGVFVQGLPNAEQLRSIIDQTEK